MKSLRIVLAMIEPPLPFGNAAARWFYVLLRGLVERGHQVTALAACSKPGEIKQAAELFPAPKYDLRCFPFPENRGLIAKWKSFRRPYSYMFSPEMLAAWQQARSSGYDILHLEQLWTGWLGLEDPARSLVNVHHLCWIDLEHARPAGWRERLGQWRMLQTERYLVRRLRHFRSCSPRLVPEILRENPNAQITTVPVGIDPARYEYIADDRRTSEPLLSVIGTMDWYPSYSAAVRLLTQLWPKIKAQVPEARVQVVGWNARTALKTFLGMPDVTIEENVPEIRPYFERTGVMLYAPGRGSGMKIKILEALGFGIPVVTTSEGVEGLPAVDGQQAGVAEDDEGLIERAVRLLRDPAAQNRQRAAGRALLENNCGPAPTVDAIEAIYAKMLGGA